MKLFTHICIVSSLYSSIKQNVVDIELSSSLPVQPLHLLRLIRRQSYIALAQGYIRRLVYDLALVDPGVDLQGAFLPLGRHHDLFLIPGLFMPEGDLQGFWLLISKAQLVYLLGAEAVLCHGRTSRSSLIRLKEL